MDVDDELHEKPDLYSDQPKQMEKSDQEKKPNTKSIVGAGSTSWMMMKNDSAIKRVQYRGLIKCSMVLGRS